MSQVPDQDDSCDDQAVATYLAAHPDFFSAHAELLPEMRIGHDSGGAVSLIERQVLLLREQHESCQHRLRDLVDTARDNDRLAGRMHTLALGLLECTALAETARSIHASLAGSFQADRVALLLFEDRVTGNALEGVTWCSASAAEMAEFENILSSRAPICGRLTANQLSTLFGDDLTAIASAVVIPLAEETTFGLLAIGSNDADRYQHGMGTSFLQQLGQLAGCALHRHLEPRATQQPGREAD